MALIKCQECGQTISDKAVVCPHCGAPINRDSTDSGNGQEACRPVAAATGKSRLIRIIIVLAALAVVCVGGYIAWHCLSSGKKEVTITPEFIENVHKYDGVLSFHNGGAIVRKDDKYGVINTKGEEIVPCQYADTDKVLKPYYVMADFVVGADMCEEGEDNDIGEEDVTIFLENGRYGIKTKEGDIIVSPKYTGASRFSHGVAAVEISVQGADSWEYFSGYVDKQGNETFTKADYDKMDAIKEEKRLKEEEEKRRGTEIVVTLGYTRNGNNLTVHGSHGGNHYSPALLGDVVSDAIRVPYGKIWVFKRYELTGNGLWHYTPKLLLLRGGTPNNVNNYYEARTLKNDDVFKIDGGKHFRVSILSHHTNGKETLKVYFQEKLEEYY